MWNQCWIPKKLQFYKVIEKVLSDLAAPFPVRHLLLLFWSSLISKYVFLFFTINFCHKIEQLRCSQFIFFQVPCGFFKNHQNKFGRIVYIFCFTVIPFSSLSSWMYFQIRGHSSCPTLENVILWQSNILKINSHLVGTCLRRPPPSLLNTKFISASAHCEESEK